MATLSPAAELAATCHDDRLLVVSYRDPQQDRPEWGSESGLGGTAHEPHRYLVRIYGLSRSAGWPGGPLVPLWHRLTAQELDALGVGIRPTPLSVGGLVLTIRPRYPDVGVFAREVWWLLGKPDTQPAFL